MAFYDENGRVVENPFPRPEPSFAHLELTWLLRRVHAQIDRDAKNAMRAIRRRTTSALATIERGNA